MKSYLTTLAALACLTFPAWGDVTVEQLAVGQNNADVNVRIVVTADSAPFTATLYTRSGPEAPWRFAATRSQAQGTRMVWEADSHASPALKAVALAENLETKVVVTDVSGATLAEKADGFSYEAAGR